MSVIVTGHDPFRPKPSKAETRADITNHAARAIIGAEDERRDAKTARLREARLDAEARLSAVTAPGKPRRLKPAAPRRARSSM